MNHEEILVRRLYLLEESSLRFFAEFTVDDVVAMLPASRTGSRSTVLSDLKWLVDHAWEISDTGRIRLVKKGWVGKSWVFRFMPCVKAQAYRSDADAIWERWNT